MSLLVAEQLRESLLRGTETDFFWLHTSQFEKWLDLWVAVSAQMGYNVGVIDPDAMRAKMIEAMWRPR